MKKSICIIFLFFYFSTIYSENAYQHLIMYGQSLSVGAQSYPLLSRVNAPGNYMLGEQIWINYYNKGPRTVLNPLVGKIANQNANGDTTLYAFSTTGTITAECPLYGVVNHLQKKIGGKFIATSCGTSGMSIEELSKESGTKVYYTMDFTSAINYGKTATQSIGSSISCPAIFWMQGENNYAQTGSGLTSGSKSTNDKNAYKQLLLTLKNNMQNDIVAKYAQSEKPAFITYQVGCQYTRGKELSIGMSQLEASNEYADIICAGPVYPYPDRGGHLDPNGYRWYGEMLAKVYYKTQTLGEDFKPLQPLKIMRTTDPKLVKIQYHIPAPPLVLDTRTLKQYADYGFEVYKNNVKQDIITVAVDGDCILLTCTQDLSGAAVEVVYAGLGTQGHGNVRDSDDYPSYYTYLDLDKKDSNGNFVYFRTSNGISYRPDDEPKNQSGQVIYDQPYPLCNWSVAYYYKLEQDQSSITVSFSVAANDPKTLTVTHSTAGSMQSEITTALTAAGKTAVEIETLVVSGDAYLTYVDCQAIAATFNTDALKTLDLSGAVFENNSTPDNVGNNGAFNVSTAVVPNEGMQVTKVILPEGLKEIGVRFLGKFRKLTNVNIPASVEIIDIYAFVACEKLVSLSLPVGLKTIREYAFYQCNFLELSELPASLTALQNFAFYQTSVSISSFPTGITTIPSNCFNPNVTTNLTRAKITSLTLHEGITNIGTKAFATQKALTSITVQRTTPPATVADAFDGITLTNVNLYISVGSINNYNSVEPWKYMIIHDNLPSGIPEVKNVYMEITPNPVNNQITMKVPDDLVIESVKILSLMGAVMKEYVNPASLSFDVSTLQKGMYLLRLNNDISVKFIKQ